MKKILFITGTVLSCTTVFAQEPADALRYSWIIPSGTARQQAIGGAMGSLGGDVSAVFVNPAGLGFYRTGDVVFTPGYQIGKTRSTYFGHEEKEGRNNLDFGTSGVVLGGSVSKNNSTAIAIAFNSSASFSDHTLYRGVNNQSSYSHRFLEEIDGIGDPNAVAFNYPFGTSLAFNTYWIDTVAGGSPGNYNFQTRAPFATGLIQENDIVSRGRMSELAIAFAGNRSDKWLFGFTLGIPFVNFDRESVFTEADAGTDPGNKFDFASIQENLTTSGTGLNLKLGAIYKPREYVRLGLSVHTPTLMMMTDVYSASVTTDTEDYEGILTQSSTDLLGSDAEFKYWMVSPYKVIASASYVLREIEDVTRQRGFITADIEYVNHRASSFTTDPEGDNSEATKDYLKSVNRAIDNAYRGAFNFRVGGELKFTTIMGRLGAAYYGNPYKNLNGEKGHRFQLSGGLGYRNKGIFIDASYVHTMGRDQHFAYRLNSRPFQAANLKTTRGNILITLGIKI
jgi:hypothetical protein